MTEIHVECLLGVRVLDRSGRSIGCLEELKAEQRGDELVVTEYHVGSFAMIERLSAWSIGRAVLRLFGSAGEHGGYCVPWDKLDLSDPDKPRLRCAVEELEPVR